MQFTFFEMYTIFISMRSRADNKEVVVPRMFNRFSWIIWLEAFAECLIFTMWCWLVWLVWLDRKRSYVRYREHGNQVNCFANTIDNVNGRDCITGYFMGDDTNDDPRIKVIELETYYINSSENLNHTLYKKWNQ